jgi:hypothetical protein
MNWNISLNSQLKERREKHIQMWFNLRKSTITAYYIIILKAFLAKNARL